MQVEREQRVRQLETDIIDINEVMRDLSAMVHTQGEIVGMYHAHNRLLLIFFFFFFSKSQHHFSIAKYGLPSLLYSHFSLSTFLGLRRFGYPRLTI